MAKASRRRSVRALSLGDPRVEGHLRMVLDPCNAPLVPTAYRGSDGYLTRFNNVYSITTGNTSTAFVFAFYPAYNGVWYGSLADANATGTASWATPGPGQAFLLASAESQRAVSACVRAEYVGTELDRQGVIYTGVVPETALSSLSTFVQKQALLQKVIRTPDHTIETKWVPMSIEEEYWAPGPTAPGSSSDRNVIVLIGSGFGAGVQFNFQTTLIAEWRPKYGIGMQQPTPSTRDPPAGLERVRTALASLGHWWVEGATTLAQAASVGARMYNSTRMLSTAGRMAALTM